MTREEIETMPELVDYVFSESLMTESKEKLHKRLDEICNLAIKALEQEPQATITQQIAESNQQITKSLQDSLKAGGNNATMLNYELSAIDRRLADISVTLAMIADRLGGD